MCDKKIRFGIIVTDLWRCLYAATDCVYLLSRPFALVLGVACSAFMGFVCVFVSIVFHVFF